MKRDILIQQIVIGPLEVHTYIVACPKTRKGVVIDPGGEVDRILSRIHAERVEIVYILNTHGHTDHVHGNSKLKALLSVPILRHQADEWLVTGGKYHHVPGEAVDSPSQNMETNDLLKDADVLQIGTLSIRVIHTPGHTPGSICFYVKDNLFTGDTLFVGDVGRTDLKGGSFETLIESLRNKIIALPDETIVWPGHDYGVTPYSTIGREKKENPYITDYAFSG